MPEYYPRRPEQLAQVGPDSRLTEGATNSALGLVLELCMLPSHPVALGALQV